MHGVNIKFKVQLNIFVYKIHFKIPNNIDITLLYIVQ
jgi:hypothetical protein